MEIYDNADLYIFGNNLKKPHLVYTEVSVQFFYLKNVTLLQYTITALGTDSEARNCFIIPNKQLKYILFNI
jgi:hypothetical protein